MMQLCALVAFTFSPYKSPTNRICKTGRIRKQFQKYLRPDSTGKERSLENETILKNDNNVTIFRHQTH